MVQVREKDTVRVTVVIPSFNEQEHIRDCLRSVLNQQTPFAYEVIVVDSSVDATPEIVRREFPTVRLIRCGERIFPAQARNIGIHQAQAPLVAFIDADCIAESTWIDAIVRAHQDRYVAIGGSISLSTPFTLPGAMLFAIEFSEYFPATGCRQIRWLPSCNLSVKREALEKYGAFPNQFEASEDMLFSRNLMIESGTPLWFDPGIKIGHSNCNTRSEYRRKLRKLGYWSGRSRGVAILPGGFFVRYPVLIPLLVPYRFVAILLRLLIRSGNKKLVALSFLCWPLLLYGLTCWARAFWRGVNDAKQEREAREGLIQNEG
jgi:glycosyltransferase involved in cell wall biosynthesis